MTTFSFVETALVVCDVCEGRGFVKLRGGAKKPETH
jgi:hypothetical protein